MQTLLALVSALKAFVHLLGDAVPLIGCIPDICPQEYTDLQSLVTCLDLGVVVETVCSHARLCQAAHLGGCCDAVGKHPDSCLA